MKQSGNALIFILIAVFLLGGLTVLLTRTGNETETTGDREKLSLEVSKLLRYTNSIQTAIEQMRLRGVSENEISFANTIYQQCNNTPIQGPGHNNRCTRPECEIFHVRGGAITPIDTPEALKLGGTCAWWKSGAMALDLKRVVNIGSAAGNELLLEVSSLSKDACLEINRRLGIAPISGEPPSDDDSGGAQFAGTYTLNGPQIGDEAAALVGRKSFCLRRPGDGAYNFYTVLIAK